MKKILNDPFNFVDETMEGILAAHGDMLKAAKGNPRAVVRKDCPCIGKVAIATGGGSGHLPVFLGYVGKGMAHGCSVGNVFSSPTSKQMKEVTRAIDGGKGVLYIYGRYQGDMMNFDMSAEDCIDDGIPVETVMVTDDVASAPPEDWQKRRGVAGLFFAYKIAGAKAETGASLAEVKAVTEKTVQNLRSMGVALSACTVPTAGKPTFEVPEDQMEIGMGIHGEAGIKRCKMESAHNIAKTLVQYIVEDLPYKSGDEVAVLVNSLGGTPLEELYILYSEVQKLLDQYNIRIYKPYIGRYACSMEMQGASLSLLRLDAELKDLLDAPAETPFFIQK